MIAAALRRLTRAAAFAAAGVLLASASTDAVQAASRICRQLEAEMAGGGRASPSQMRKYDASIAKQREQLVLARKQSRSAGCGFSLFGGGVAKCGGINAKIEKMERNLDALERKRGELAGGGSARSQARIADAMIANGCRDEAVAERGVPEGIDRNQTLLNEIFGGGLRQREAPDAGFDANRERNVRRLLDLRGGTFLDDEDGDGIDDGGDVPADENTLFAPPGEYRTACVRTCDGYFFPMSNASSLGDLDRDLKNCEASCPGADVDVYYRRADDESAEMVSAHSGAPYSALPTADLYKQSNTPSPAGCGCNSLSQPKSFSIIAGNPPPAEAPAEPILPAPAAESGITAKATGPDDKILQQTAVAPDTLPAPPPSGERKVRVVGPEFLPDPAAAIDLRAPALRQVR